MENSSQSQHRDTVFLSSFKQCQACEKEKVVDLGCGSFETTCVCRQPRNCHPPKPTPPKCHKTVKVISQDSSMCDHDKGIDQCKACYHWNFLPVKYEINNVVIVFFILFSLFSLHQLLSWRKETRQLLKVVTTLEECCS